MTQRSVAVATVALLCVLALVAGILLATQRANVALRAEAEELRSELDRAQAELEEERRRQEPATPAPDPAPSAPAPPDPSPSAPEGLPDDLAPGQGLGGLLDEFLGGGENGLEDQLGGLAGCLGADDGGLGGLLGGGNPVLADDLREQLDLIAGRVESLRGLEQLEPLSPTYLTTDEIGERARQLTLDDYAPEVADLDRRVLAALGAIPADLDLREAAADLIAGQVAGYYDTETGELVVRTDDPSSPLPPIDQITLAHELQHAIADQHLGLDDVEGDPAVPSDTALARLSVVEGDATLVMQRFAVSAISLSDQLALGSDPGAAASQEQLEAFPSYLQAQLLFPYTEGLGFVCSLEATGGWPAVDAAYADGPTTTAEILFPERFGAPPPEEPRTPTAPGGAWSEVRTDVLGAADLLWLFSAPGDDEAAALDEARERAAAWDGSRMTLWTDGPASALGVALRDGGEGSAPLCSSVVAWYEAGFPDAVAAPAEGAALVLDGPVQDAVVRCDGDEVRLGIAPDLVTARTIAG